MTRFLCCGVLLSACTVLNVEVKGRTEQLVGDEVAGPTPTGIVGVTTSRSPRMQAVVADERDRACTAP